MCELGVLIFQLDTKMTKKLCYNKGCAQNFDENENKYGELSPTWVSVLAVKIYSLPLVKYVFSEIIGDCYQRQNYAAHCIELRGKIRI